MLENFLLKNKIDFVMNKPLSTLTSMGVGGKAKWVVYPKSRSQLVLVVKFCRQINQKFYLLGGGTNVIACDKGFDGVVIATTKVSKTKRIFNTVLVDAGTPTAKLALNLQKWGLGGGEFCCCIPGTVGGAVVGNAGCFGKSFSDIVQKVWIFDGQKVKVLTNAQCLFDYRTSIFQFENWTLLKIQLKFAPKSKKRIKEEMQSLKVYKARSQPTMCRSSGCIFRNGNQPSAKLIDKALLKGYRINKAQVSVVHAGFIVNLGGAKASDVLDLITHVKTVVKEKYGVTLKEEVRILK